MCIEANRFCCVQVSNEEDQTRTKEINAILSLSKVCMCTLLLMMLGLNGVVFNCLAVKVNSADGVVLDIYSLKRMKG